MKKRIIALILVVVMLTLSLVSCGYSIREDDLSKYATLEKTKLDAALKALVISEATFGSDEAKRQEQVIDAIYADLADLAKDGDHITEGKIGDHDIVFYSYYATVEGHVIYASTMKPGAELSVQLGLNATDGVAKLIADKFAALEDVKDYIYKTSTDKNATTDAGKVAYISYTEEYVQKGADGVDSNIKNVVTYEKVTIGDEAHNVAKELVGVKIGDAIENFSVEVELADGSITKNYSGVKIDWVVDAGQAVSFTDKTFTETKSVKDIMGASVELMNKDITYFVYPVYYVEVEEFGADAIMNSLLAKFVTTTTAEDGTTKEEGVLPSFTAQLELVKAYAELVTALATAETAYNNAVKEEEKALTALNTAKDAVKEGEPTEAQKDTINKAQTAYDAAKTTTANAKTSLDEATKNRDDKLAEIYTKITPETIVSEYKKSIYDELLAKYNSEIKASLAKAVWTLLNDENYVKVNATPDKAVDEIYKRMIESYESTFYDGTYDTTTKESNYKHYKASFSAFLVAKTGTSSYEAAKQHVWDEAVKYVKPMVIVYYVAEVYGQKLTDDEIKAYQKDLTGYYSYYEAYYGETNTLTAYQFDKLMNYFLESEEKDGNVTYKNITYTFKTEEK